MTVLTLLAVSLFLQHEFHLRQALLFLLGVALGITLLHAAFGFTGGWRRMIRERRGASVRAQILLLVLTSALFFPVLGQVFAGVGASGALGPVGVSVVVGAFMFGIGMQLGGGCGSYNRKYLSNLLINIFYCGKMYTLNYERIEVK